MVSKLKSTGLLGINAYMIDVEADISNGLPAFDVVGLPDTSVKESRDRVRAAIKNNGFNFPVSRITVNLAPADIRKEGAIYDLPILLSVMAASRQIKVDLSSSAFIGELSLLGELRPVRGALPMAIKAREYGIERFYLPAVNAAEASIVKGIEIYPVENVKELIEHLTGEKAIAPASFHDAPLAISDLAPDFSEVRGQSVAKRALEIAAAGGHNVLLIGPPGSGKSMLAKRLPSILPAMTFDESIETTMIHSIAGVLDPNTPLVKLRPFRSPHHTVSPAGLSGGGTIPHPGEISLAHNGVLFLDELPEFSRGAMEILRQPLEDGKVTISRVFGSISYPCSTMLIAAMNPCPCGYYGHPSRKCTCSPSMVSRYLGKISGPLLDRIDLHVEVAPVNFDDLDSSQSSEKSADILKRVNNARDIQRQRFDGHSTTCNARITPDLLHKVCPMTDSARTLLKDAFEKLGFSGRAYDRVLKVARTIADLGGCEVIDSAHITEAVQYRTLDRKYWSNRNQ